MSLENQINQDIKEAMLAKDKTRLASVRAIKAAILLAKTAENATGELTDSDIVKLIQKLVKQRKESAEIYIQSKREDMAQAELAEAACMEPYLPKALTEAELTQILKDIIAKVGAKGPQDMGKVMGMATKQLAGQADGRIISTLVKQLLA